MEFDILGVNLSLNEDEVRNGNTQDPGKMHLNYCKKFCSAALYNFKYMLMM